MASQISSENEPIVESGMPGDSGAVGEPYGPRGRNGEQAADQRGRSGNGAIDRGAFHQGTDDAQMFFRSGAFVHEIAL